jgi:hypothetical protein
MDKHQKAERVTLLYGRLSVLQSIRFTGLQNEITGDESWFFLSYSRDSIWAPARDEVPERVSQTINAKSVSFHFFCLSIESRALLMLRKAAHIIQHSLAILSYQVCLTELLYIPEENHSKVYTSTWTIHIHIIQDHSLMSPRKKNPADTAPGLQSGLRTKRLLPF